MYYEINVSLKGQHFFATAERSINNERKLKDVYKALKEKFTEEDGYNISVTKYENIGHFIDMKGIVDNEAN